jgi:hypothetical protein
VSFRKDVCDTIKRSGLRTVDLRTSSEDNMPSDDLFFAAGQREIVYVGITGFRKFDRNIEGMKAALRAGKRVMFLVLDCRTSAGRQVKQIEQNDIYAEFDSGMSKAIAAGLFAYPMFEVRVRDNVPNYAGYFIDSDVSLPVTATITDAATIRLQPRTQSFSQHFGFVLHIARTDSNRDVFDEYVHDVRQQWSVGKPYNPKVAHWTCASVGLK